MKSILEDHDDVPPFDPKKVALFVVLLALIALAGWRFWRAQAAVRAVAEASKDYRKLFPARTEATTAPPPKPVVEAQAPMSGIGLLKIDDDMRTPKRVPAPAPSAEPPPPEPAPVVEAKAEPAAPVMPEKKVFNQPRLTSDAFSGLNGGSGMTFSGGNSGSSTPPPATTGK